MRECAFEKKKSLKKNIKNFPPYFYQSLKKTLKILTI